MCVFILGEVVQWRHSEAGHHCLATLFGQKLVPNCLLALECMLNLMEDEEDEEMA